MKKVTGASFGAPLAFPSPFRDDFACRETKDTTMRPLLIPLLIPATLFGPLPALADRIEASAPVRAVTLYPWGAQVTRIVDLSAPAGTHDIVIPGLPADIDPASLRVRAEGATLGAVSLQQSRTQPGDEAKTPAVEPAEAEVLDREKDLIAFDAQIEQIRAEGQAAGDMVRFLVAGAEGWAGAQASGESLKLIDQRLQQARLAEAGALAAARETELGRDRLTDALDRARQRLEALQAPETGRHTLILAIETGDAPARIEITGLVAQASWQPVYDFFLDRDDGRLTLERGLLVSQDSGEDWQDVALTLSTARPSGQSAPSRLEPWFPRIADREEVRPQAAAAPAGVADMAAFDAEMPLTRRVAETALSRIMGSTVVYDYPAPVTIRSGVDALRLRLDSRDLEPAIRAEAVPARDSTAYLVAETENTTEEVILPGAATFHADGAMVGQGQIELVPAGETFRLGFGPVDGLVAEYEVSDQHEGDRGLISRSNTRSQKTVLRVRNLTGKSWPLRVIGQVPVPVQEDLRIRWSADPAPSSQDPEGQRGLLHWDSEIDPGQDIGIEVTTEMSWPEGKRLLNDRP